MSVIDRAAHAAPQPQQSDFPDFARGCREIGETLGIDHRSAWNLITTGSLKSVKRVGGRYWASRSRLLREVGGE